MKYDYIALGDCLPQLKTLPGQSIDLTITSPPYDNLRDYTGFDWNFEEIAKELYRVTKEGGVVVWIVADGTANGSETGSSFKQALFFMQCGFRLNDTMIWEKDSFSFPELVRYPQVFEYMFIFSKGKPKTFNPIRDRKNKHCGMAIHGTYRQKDGSTIPRGERWTDNGGIKEYGFRFNVWHIPSVKNNRTGHPAVFPESLVIDHIKTWSNKGDVILDIFLGSGTTALAAIKTERHYIGFEISNEYFKIAQQRIKARLNEGQQLCLFDSTNEVKRNDHI